MIGVPIRETEEVGETQMPEKERYVKTDAGVGVLQLQVRESLEPLDTGRSRGEFSPTAHRKSTALPTLVSDFCA
jgi:hypothetical protein